MLHGTYSRLPVRRGTLDARGLHTRARALQVPFKYTLDFEIRPPGQPTHWGVLSGLLSVVDSRLELQFLFRPLGLSSPTSLKLKEAVAGADCKSESPGPGVPRTLYAHRQNKSLGRSFWPNVSRK